MARRILSCFGRPSFLSSAKTSSSTPNTNANAIENDSDTLEDNQSFVEPGPVVVVELFSSQGCAVSPVAETLISRLGRGDFKFEMQVVVLAYHVDYWDYAGWKDPFGSSLCTVRQKDYVEALRIDMLSTPLVVVQGRAHCVGDDEEALMATIKSAPQFTGLPFRAKFVITEQHTLKVTLTGTIRSHIGTDDAFVIAILYESGHVTDCPSGENKGKVISNDYVVRKLEKLCSVKDIVGKKTVSETFEFGLWEGFNSSKCGMALLVQNKEQHIFGSQNFMLPYNLS